MEATQKPRIVTLTQVSMSIACTIIGVGILAFPRITVNYAKTAAPIATIAAVILIMGGGLTLSYLGNQYRDNTLFEYADRIIGKWLGGIIALLFSIYFLELAALSAREFGEVVATVVLPRTPIEVTVLVMLFLAASASRNDIAVFARILTFYMPFVYFPMLVITILTLKNAQFVNIFPALDLSHSTKVSGIARATLVVAALFQNYVIIGLFIPFMYQPKKAWKGVLLGVGAAGMLFIMLIYGTMAVFGIEEMHHLLWPTLELGKTAALPTFFIERLDPIIVAVWVTTVFTGLLSSYYVAIQGLSHLFRFKNHKVFTVALIPFVFILAMQPPNVVDLYKIVETIGVTGLLFSIGYPVLLLVLHSLRKVREKRKDRMEAV